jgi:hemoglobin-like flavoprotein
MDQQSINLIRGSWEKLSVEPNKMMEFYDNLFEIAPDTRKLFPDDVSKQSEKLAYTITFLVSNLERIEEIKESIEDLGRIHNKLNIKPEYYGFVVQALLKTMKDTLQEQYNLETEEAWKAALTYVAEVMINAPEKRENRLKRLINKLFG